MGMNLDNDFWIYEEVIKNFKKDIRTVKAFKDYLEKEDYIDLSEYLESFFDKELKDKKEKLDKVVKRFEKVKAEQT